ncbi:hypothetical protein Hanom_Chr13g01216401 [Helianthus anomalus]
MVMRILKARRTWSMTSFGMKTRREGTQKMKMIELPLTIINTTRISSIKIKSFTSITQGGAYVKGEFINTLSI